jgi:hypothetical protein
VAAIATIQIKVKYAAVTMRTLVNRLIMAKNSLCFNAKAPKQQELTLPLEGLTGQVDGEIQQDS